MKKSLTTFTIYAIAILAILFEQKLFAQKLHLITGSYTKENKVGIHFITINLANQNIQISPLDSSIANPSYLFYAKKEQILYGVSEGRGKEKALAVSWKFNPKRATLSLINTTYSGGDHPCHLFVDLKNKYLYTANYSGGNIGVIPILQKGKLGNIQQVIQHKGAGLDTIYQRSPHAHQVIFKNQENQLIATDLGTDEIKFYSINHKEVQPVSERNVETVKTTPGAGPRHVSFHPNQPIMYVLEELSGTLAVYEKLDQIWNLVQRFELYNKEEKGVKASAHIVINKNAKDLYCSNRGDNNTLAHFRIEPNGRVSRPTIYPLNYKWPRHFSLDASESFLAVAYQHSNFIEIFKRDQSNGSLHPLNIQIKIPYPVFAEFIDLK